MKAGPSTGGQVSALSDPTERLRFAHDDLAAARLLLTDPGLPMRLACFHAQQAAEKALKASLIDAGIHFRKTHDLAVLVALQPVAVRSAVSDLDLQQLQQWAVDARYPADLPDITSGEAAAVVRLSEHIVVAVESALREVAHRDTRHQPENSADT